MGLRRLASRGDGRRLLTGRGPWCVLWASAFFPCGAEVFQAPVPERIVGGGSGPGSRAAGGPDRWQPGTGSPVADVRAFWERFTVGPGHAGEVRVSGPYEADVPAALRAGFSAGPAWMAAGIPQVPGMRGVFMPGDEIMAVFTAGRMRQTGFPDSGFPTVSRG